MTQHIGDAVVVREGETAEELRDRSARERVTQRVRGRARERERERERERVSE